MALEKLIDLFIEFVGLFQCWVYVDEYEKGVVLRLGRFHRTIDPGMRWVLPLGLERAIITNSKPDPLYLHQQSLHTADDYIVNIQIGVIWRITDIKAFLIDNENTEHMVGMLCAGSVARSVQGCKWKDIAHPGYPDTLKSPMNRKVRKRGVEIDEVVIQDFAAGTANRLWVDGVSLSVGE